MAFCKIPMENFSSKGNGKDLLYIHCSCRLCYVAIPWDFSLLHVGHVTCSFLGGHLICIYFIILLEKVFPSSIEQFV